MNSTRTLPRTAGVLACEFWRRLAASPHCRGADAPGLGARPSGRRDVPTPARALNTPSAPSPPPFPTATQPLTICEPPTPPTPLRPKGRAPAPLR